MKYLELVQLAVGRLAAARLRAVLTMLGVIIGVGSIVALVSVAQGATSGITSRIENLGTNLLTVMPGSMTSGFVRQGAGTATTLTLDDARAITELADVSAISPSASTQAIVVAGDENTTTSVIGTTSGYLDVRTYEVWQGSFLTDVSVAEELNVAVLGATTADDLGLGAADVGSEILVGGIPFRIVGILQSKGTGDDMVIVPITTAQRYFVPGDSVSSIYLSVSTAEAVDSVKTALTSLLETRHGAYGSDADFSISDQAQLLDTFSSVTGLLTLLLGGIASISLLVGGIGIMNIMLVSVRERTREIGIRKAIGARGPDILLQFLVEALVLSVVGGLIGIALGVAASVAIGAVAGWGFQFSPLTVVVALGFSLGVGVVFGVWPARQAARLDPITALRYE